MHKVTKEQVALGRLIQDGLTYEEIAKRLGITPRQAKTQTDRLRWILGVKYKRQVPEVMRKLGLL